MKVSFIRAQSGKKETPAQTKVSFIQAQSGKKETFNTSSTG